MGCQYIPSAEYFAHWLHHELIIVEQHEHFQKRTWRNKTAILSTDKPLHLTVPLKKGKHMQMAITDVEISYDGQWHRIHFNSIRTAYGKTAYYHEIESDLKNMFMSLPAGLWDFNLSFLKFITSLMKGSWLISYTQEYVSRHAATTIDLRYGIPAGISANPKIKVPVYNQVQRLNNSHLSNLSILDVLCHLGPDTVHYLSQYANQLYPKEC